MLIMEEKRDGNISVASRIKQLATVLPAINSPTLQVPRQSGTNSNMLNAKLNPTARRRHRTEQISTESLTALRRTSSNPDLEQFVLSRNAKPSPSPKPAFRSQHGVQIDHDAAMDPSCLISDSRTESFDHSVSPNFKSSGSTSKPILMASKPLVTAKPKFLQVQPTDSNLQPSNQTPLVNASSKPRVPTKKVVSRDKRASSDAGPPAFLLLEKGSVGSHLAQSISVDAASEVVPLGSHYQKETFSVVEVVDGGSVKVVSGLEIDLDHNNETGLKRKSGPPSRPVPPGPDSASSATALVGESLPFLVIRSKDSTYESPPSCVASSAGDTSCSNTQDLVTLVPPKPPRGKSQNKGGLHEDNDLGSGEQLQSGVILASPAKNSSASKSPRMPETLLPSESSRLDTTKKSILPTKVFKSQDTSPTSKHAPHPRPKFKGGSKMSEKVVASLQKSCPPGSGAVVKQERLPLPVSKQTVVPPVPFHQRLRSKSDQNTSDEDYNYAYDHMPASLLKPGIASNSSDDESVEYDSPDQSGVQDFEGSSQKHEVNSDDSDYEEPPDADYEEPFHEQYVSKQEKVTVLPVETKKGNASSSDEDYCDPDVTPPTSPSAFIIPGHSQNNLDSSTDDDDDAYDYTDPEEYLPKLPLHLKLSSRRGSQQHRLDPSLYVPIKEIAISGLAHDDDIHPEYVDPEKAIPTFLVGKPGHDDGDDIYSDEPLYQVYQADLLEEVRRLSKKQEQDLQANAEKEEDDMCSEYISTSQKSMRLLWCELPSVRTSGLLDNTPEAERKRQEAMFEVISSEASYLKSLDILVSHFVMCKDFSPKQASVDAETGSSDEPILDKQQYHLLFSGVTAIKAASERFLKDLRKRQQQTSALIHSISDIIIEYAEKHFDCYVKYCSNQVFQDRAYSALLHSSPRFLEVVMNLERHPCTQGLSMQSFLTLPMQRITRLPLLVDAICHRCEPDTEESRITDRALKAVQKLVRDSNEGARQMIRTEEMYFIQRMLTFKIKPVPLISASRWLVKRGNITCLQEAGRFSKYTTQLRQLLKGRYKKIHLFLFTDLLLVTKAKGEDSFKVIDYCSRSLVKLEELQSIPNPEPPKAGGLAVTQAKYAFTVILLENSNGKTVDYHCFLEAESDITRWREAFSPAKQASEYEGESVYDDWDCPQVQAIHAYQAQQPDEITLHEGDVIKVLRKLRDGWAEGLRLRDDERGWFPIGFCEEVDSKHMRARNLMQRYRLLHASKSIVDTILGNAGKK